MNTHTKTICQICGDSAGNFVNGREMMFGTREPFTYFECGHCGCLQLIDVPNDLSPYYPTDYYSLAPSARVPARSKLRQAVNNCRNAGCLFGHNPLSWLLSKARSGGHLRRMARMLRPTGIRSLNAKILDVGCGGGELLSEMAAAGFQALVGIDPYASARTEAGGRLRIHATNLDRLDETDFDLVMSHHSLEHVGDQIGTLRHMRRVLKDGGACLVRVPVASSEVWRTYRENWVELDPPRHLVVHTQRSFEIAAKEAGLHLERAEYDDTAFGYWGSELYTADIPLTDPETRKYISPLSNFNQSQIDEFERAALSANARQDGGRAAFYLRKL